MENLGREIRNLASYPGHFCSKKIIEMTLSEQEQRSDVSDNLRLHTLRTRLKKCNLEELTETSDIKAPDGLLRKSVSVNVAKLSASKLQTASEMRDKMRENKTKKGFITIRDPSIKWNDNRNKRRVKKNASFRTISIDSTPSDNCNKSDRMNLLKDIKQPCIKLRRIDEVISKIARSFAKVIPNKECKANVHTGHIKETKPELIDLVSDSRAVGIDVSHENNKTSESDLDINNSLQSNIAQSDTDQSSVDINRNACKTVFRKKRKIIYDSDDNSYSSNNKSSNRHNVSSRDAKVSKLDLPEKETEDAGDVQIMEVTESTKDMNKMPMMEMETLRNVSFRNESHNFSNQQNLATKSADVSNHNLSATESISSKSCHDDANETNVTRGSEINALRTLNDENIRNPIIEPVVTGKDLTAKYNLLKELRVCLVQLDHIKCSTNNRYSASEVEQRMRRCMKFLNNFKFVYSQRSFVDKDIEIERINDVVDTVEPMEHTLVLDSNVDELSRNTQIKEEIDLNDEEISNDLIESPEKVFESNTSHRPFPIKSITKGSKLSSVTKNIVETKKSGDRSQSVTIDKMYSLNKELPEVLLHTISPKKASNNGKARSLDTIHTDAYNIILSKKPVSNRNEKVHISGRKTFVTKIHAKTVNIINPKVNTKKNISSCQSIVSLNKHKKSMDKKDNNKGVSFRCIVCDLCFENYSGLQHHLVTHTQKQNNNVSSKESASICSENRRETVICSSESRKAESLQPSKRERTARNMSASNARKKTKPFSKKRAKFNDSLYEPSECSICSKAFPTATDLAAHIFLHTEHELQMAYKTIKRKSVKFKQTAKQSGGDEKTRLAAKQSSKVVDEPEELPSATQPLRVEIVSTIELSTTATTTAPRNTVTTVTDTLRTNESPVATESSSQKLHLLSTQGKSEKKKAKKFAKICNCHNATETDDDCLKIEIALVCRTCKVLFRSMDCFNEHYNLPEYESCKENRVRGGRTPNLLCTACGITFSSVQDVRSHLESHALVKRDCRTHFRCTICKVIFIGIGPLFYVHWSIHLQDPYWIADETTFPVDSVIKPRLDQNKKTPSTSEETYVQVAEHICDICKAHFVSDNDLKEHNLKCKIPDNSDNSNAEKPLEMEVNCNLCNHVFTERLPFYRHVRDKHNFIGEPQFVCVSLTVIKTAYICNICMEISESIEDFEDHWLKHSTAAVLFTCTCCTQAYCNDLNAFLEHARTHKVNVKQYVPSCTVAFENVAFTCKQCNIGFQSERVLREHDVIHNINQVNSAETAALNSGKSPISDTLKSAELAGEKQKEDDTSRSMERRDKVRPIESAKDKDREKLISILEGDDDSEHELIVDWIEKLEVEKGSSEKQRNGKERATMDKALSASSTVQMPTVSESDTVNGSTRNAMEQAPENGTASASSKSAVVPTSSEACTSDASEISVSSIQENRSEASKQSNRLDVQTTEDNTPCGSTKDKEDLTSSKQNSPPRPRQGFLRVKSLAELTNRPTPAEVEVNQIPKPSSSIVFHHPSVSGKRITAAVSTSAMIDNQRFKQPQAYVNTGQRFVQSSTSTYRRNLSTCNIAQPVSTVPRHVRRRENISASTSATVSLQNQRAENMMPSSTSPLSVNTTNNTRNLSRSNLSVFSAQPSTVNTNSSHQERRVVVGMTGYKNDDRTTAAKAVAVNNSQKSQRMMINPSREISTICYKNSNNNSGGMSIVINQTTPAVSDMSTINTMGKEPRQLYQPQIYKDPIVVLDHSYAQQTPIVNDFSPPNNVYQVVTVPNRENHSTYKVRLPRPIFVCSHCPDTFSSAELLELHRNMNHNFPCDICGQRLHSFNEINTHKIKHNFI